MVDEGASSAEREHGPSEEDVAGERHDKVGVRVDDQKSS